MKLKLLKQAMFAVVLFLTGIISAQTVTVTGTVTDANGPMLGVNVIEKGTVNGVTTDFDGNYTINVASDAILVFSFVGYKTQEISVDGKTTINVTMQEDTALLEEVVVIGYGTTTVKDATGAVSAVTSDDFNGGVIASPEELIQGKTAGVQITQTSGEPGAGINIRIRGTTSVRSNNNPLFVVDGVPLAGDNTSATGQDLGFGTSGSKNPLNFLNPNDIESISVLKDASSTAIYGSRGANGVVIITTKSGKGARGGAFEFSSSLSYSSPANKYDLLGREEFLGAVAQFGGDPALQDAGSNTDWQDVVTRNTLSHNQNISYSHAYKAGFVRATVGYGKQNGVMENSSLERLTGRLNWTHRLFDDKLTLNLQTTISKVDDESPAVSGSAGYRGDVLGAAYSANPTWPNDPDFDSGGQRSPATYLEYVESLTKTKRALLNFSGEYEITPEFSGKVNLGYDTSHSERSGVVSEFGRNIGDGTFGNGIGSLNDIDVKNKLLEVTLKYKKEFENSTLDALIGYSYQDFGRSGRNIRGWGFASSDLRQMVSDLETSSAAIEDAISGDYQQYGYNDQGTFFINRLFPDPITDTPSGPPSGIVGVRSVVGDFFDFTDELQSYFARVNYTLADKYLFTVTMRADGSSRFGENNQYGYFPSAAFAWKIHEEEFMGDTFSNLKLRLGAGITGNQEGLGYGNFIARQRYGGIGIKNNGSINVPGLSTVSFPNPDLKWEETTSYGVGIDFGFSNNRLTGSIDFYRKETADLLLKVQAAQPSPQPTFFKNLDAIVLNQGVEFALNYDIIRTDDLNWGASFNIAYNKNELQDFAGLIPAGTIRGQGLSNAFAQMLAGGHPLFSYYLREFKGFDQNGQPIGDVQDFVGKSALPDYTGGLSTNVGYKNWDFSAYFAGQFGHYVYNNTKNALFTAGAISNARNVTPDVLTSGEAGNAEASVSTRFLEKGDFVRLQNATIGYNVPLKEGSGIKSLRLSLNGQNLFVITKYTGLDPEVNTTSSGFLNDIPTAGIEYTSYPRPRTFTLGLNLTF
ncbi:MAG: SusC/RagA family TonB-linked outer membrane protein [Flavobacteriales bacterium]|nr:MAG: SusC/RagA family TonB-linked outer membrane protein [Flavobacteriales bacterium]